MQPPKNISKLNDFKEQVWGIIFNELKKDPLKIHEKAVGKETIIKTNQLN